MNDRKLEARPLNSGQMLRELCGRGCAGCPVRGLCFALTLALIAREIRRDKR